MTLLAPRPQRVAPTPPRIGTPRSTTPGPTAKLASAATLASPATLPSAHRSSASRVSAPRPSRDGFIDVVRALGTLVVIGLHWLMIEATWDGATLQVGNSLAHGSAWLLTWLNPLPLLFFAAGAAASYDVARRPDATGRELAWRRLRSLLAPVGIFVGSWLAAVTLLPRVGVPSEALHTAARIVVQPLWFLAVYLVLIALAPTLVRGIARRGGLAVVGILGFAAFVFDAARWVSGSTLLGWPNLVVAWAVPFALGISYAMARAAGRDISQLLAGALVVVGSAATIALIVLGPYPASLIGMPGQAISNLGPPTAPVVTFAVAQIGAALVLRSQLGRLSGSRVVAQVSAHSMPLYLWHLTAIFIVAGVVLLGLGQELSTPWTWAWWTTRPALFGACFVTLTALVAATTRLQKVAVTTAGSRQPGHHLIARTA